MDIALKQRLVGASVLIALAVVVLPMLLGGRPDRAAQETRRIELPPQPAELDFQTRRYPIGDAAAAPLALPDAAALPGGNGPVAVADSAPDAGSASGPGNGPTDGPNNRPGAVAHVELQPREFTDALEAAATAADENRSKGEPEPLSAEPTQEPDSTPEVASQPEAGTPAPQPAAGGGRYVVQVASFSSIGNANRLSETLRGHGHAVLSDTVKSDVGTLHRVRIGPFASEAQANEAAAGVRRQVGEVKPRVVDLQPEAATQAAATQLATSADPLIRWVVQVGSFSAAGNAETLVARLRGEGLSAYTETVSASGSTIYRVRVGPYLERDEALSVDRLVNERFSLDGVVMSAD
jgi:DedD protein